MEGHTHQVSTLSVLGLLIAARNESGYHLGECVNKS